MTPAASSKITGSDVAFLKEIIESIVQGDRDSYDQKIQKLISRTSEEKARVLSLTTSVCLLSFRGVRKREASIAEKNLVVEEIRKISTRNNDMQFSDQVVSDLLNRLSGSDQSKMVFGDSLLAIDSLMLFAVAALLISERTRQVRFVRSVTWSRRYEIITKMMKGSDTREVEFLKKNLSDSVKSSDEAITVVLNDIARARLPMPAIVRSTRSVTGLISDVEIFDLLSTDGSISELRLPKQYPYAQRVVVAAEQLQEWVIDELRPDVTTWPECPQHREKHPLRPKSFADEAVWVCPISNQVFAEIGKLRTQPFST